MQIIHWMLYPISATVRLSKDLGFAIINRIALEIFVVFHSIKQTPMSKEIENLTSAIAALEGGGDASTPLSHLLQDRAYTPISTDRVHKQKLLVSLKTHRLTITRLYHGVHADEQLCMDIYNYTLPPNSPLRKSHLKIE